MVLFGQISQAQKEVRFLQKPLRIDGAKFLSFPILQLRSDQVFSELSKHANCRMYPNVFFCVQAHFANLFGFLSLQVGFG